MNTISCEILIIGGGAAGMAAALSAEKKGYRKILITERREELGGVLLQCTHQGFGLGYFNEDLTGTEYAGRFRELTENSCAEIKTGMMVLKICPDRTAIMSGREGVYRVRFEKCVLATGCREKTIYSEDVSGVRPDGIMTCGTAQKLMNVDGIDIGDNIIIAGTGDVGQVVAGQLIMAGKRVIAMIEKNKEPGGLKRNREKYLEALRIPVLLNSSITKIHGNRRIEGVDIMHSDTGMTEYIACSTLLTAIGMIPERELTDECFRGQELPNWMLTAGNCDYVHDIVDSVTADGLKLF